MLRRILFGGLATWFSRGVNILLGLVLMPVLFRYLPKEELGTWLFLGQSWAALGIFDFGFGMILTRHIAFVVGRSGGANIGALTEEMAGEVSDLLAMGRRVYHWLAVVSFALSFVAGAFFLRKLAPQGLPLSVVWAAWGVLCLSQAVGIWSGVWTCLVQGVGYVGWDAILSSLVSAVTLLAQIIAVLLGGGVLSLAALAASGTMLQRLLVLSFARRKAFELLRRPGRWRAGVLRKMMTPAVRSWLTSLGYMLVANTDQIFITASRGTAALPAYRAAFLLVVNLHLLAGVFSGASQVFVSQLWQAGELAQIRAILRRNAQIGLLALGCGGGAILALGPTLFEVWLGPGNFIGYPILGIFLATFILEHHANVFSSCGRATNDEAYAVSSLIAGALKLVLAFLLINRLQLVGLALSTLVAQGLTNNWFMVYRSLKRLGVDFGEHVRHVLAPVFFILLTVLGVGLLLSALLSEQRLEVQVGMVSISTMALLAGSIWRLALDGAQRSQLLRRVGFA